MVEDVWGELLSEEEIKILSVYNRLSATEKDYVINHLNRMASEEGWHPSQTRSATYALEVLDKNSNISK